MCRLCNKADETIEHFILLCETTSQIRTSLIGKILHEGSLVLARESLQTPIDLITFIINPYYYLSKKMCKDVEDRVVTIHLKSSPSNDHYHEYSCKLFTEEEEEEEEDGQEYSNRTKTIIDMLNIITSNKEYGYASFLRTSSQTELICINMMKMNRST
ncbi:unnamed protein product [Mytilus coruscus]|uniref:Reverse transcriptase zinc-binding domain-containing protein n=1 Tax=Mytilus coruscus TaxID=42192 RepID=A0A6J8BQ36_MYTCO|nr:unnamed protein product [Mytilus coruscus]